jgi:hypothetical protein
MSLINRVKISPPKTPRRKILGKRQVISAGNDKPWKTYKRRRILVGKPLNKALSK